MMLAMLTLISVAIAQPLKVVTTVPDLAEVVREVGGDQVTVASLLKGVEDPHFLDANPAFIRQVADSDVVCFVGLELESGWLPKVLARSGKAQVQAGGQGHCDMGSRVKPLERPTLPVDRSMGDLHPMGNPHYTMSPKALGESASAVRSVLSRLRPEKDALFIENERKFVERMTKLENDVRALLKPLRDKNIAFMEYHREFTYFFNVYGLKSLGPVEEKPGVPPSAGHLAQVATRAKANRVKLVLAAPFAPDKHLRKFEELSGVRAEKVPSLVQVGDSKLDSIEKLQRHLAEQVLRAQTP